MKRIRAIVDDDSLGLDRECEVLGPQGEQLSDEMKNALEVGGYVEFFDDTKPTVGKSVNEYEDGKSYPIGRQVFKDYGVYRSTEKTSTEWIYDIDPSQSEWKVLIPPNG